ncbi:MAG: PEP-CTERM sorting domain-containing protein [Fimbriimonadaceae bacterium]|nr:PEP-CTERM sorting domain-containing protein [Fimbriimonadaceae bacterium]
MLSRNTSLSGVGRSALTLSFALLAGLAGAQISFTGAPYNQDFDTLANTGTNIAWTDNVTIAGWYMRRMNDPALELADQYNASDGTSNTGAVYSFGTTGSSERTLGSIASGSVEHTVFGARFTNNTGSTITAFNLDYVGEQWRDGNNVTLHSLMFSYKVGGTTIGDDTQAGAGTLGYGADPTFTRVASLDFTGPIGTTTARALDGNLVENQVGVSGSVTGISWGAGQDLWIRWVDLNDVGNDHGLGVDNVNLSAVPEPTSMAALAVGALGMLVRRRRR